MAISINPTKKPRKHSKKKKESWRKHIDITDVNEFLDEQRLEERIGYVLVVLMCPHNIEIIKPFTYIGKPQTKQTMNCSSLMLRQSPQSLAV